VSLRDEIAAHEGLRLVPYRDQYGYPTIGYGHLIAPDARMTLERAAAIVGAPWSRERAEHQLDEDITDKQQQLRTRLPQVVNWPAPWQDAALEMCFQMGIDGFLGFRGVIACCDAGDGQGAHDRALDSLWARQTPERAQAVAAKFLQT